MGALEYRQSPCHHCPWRTDVDLDTFSDTDFAKLSSADGTAGAEARTGAPMMSCHLDQPGTAHPMRLCAGWLATVGYHHLGVRVQVVAGALPADCLTPAPDWPALHPGLEDMLRRREAPADGSH